ncbi:helix-turn-helix domain-containing protein [Micromonospora azadirachtae]|uniref:Helix-turn-helix domain-containing protein n=1 Tax=Micromonospora azadirachtae TaxID=1970735 RepID=A0ABW2ZUY1_9ACTN
MNKWYDFHRLRVPPTRSEQVTPDASVFSRDFRALSDRHEIEAVESAMGVGKVHHNWLEMKDFAYGLLACQVDDVAFVNAQTTASTVWKEGVPGDVITITRVSEGGGTVALADSAMEISAGDAYASSTAQGFECHTPLYQDISLIAIPRPRLRRLGVPERLLQPHGELAPPDSAADVLFDFFQSFALRVKGGPGLSRKALSSVNESVVSMAAAILEEHAPAAAPGFHETAKAFIDDHLRDPGLGPETVAAALHVSKRTLYRSFADKGQTVASYIRAARLRAVKRELGHTGTAKVRDVAARWGFTNPSYFSKLFRQEFGSMPSEYARNSR